MSIQKQEFYEGAALHALLRKNPTATVKYDDPYFVINDSIFVYIKYSTATRSPWAFTFTQVEHDMLTSVDESKLPARIGLVCGSNGIVALTLSDYESIVGRAAAPLRVSCARSHRSQYAVWGPDGEVAGKISPSEWTRLPTKIEHKEDV